MFLAGTSPKVIFITACFIAVPVGLFLLHLFLSFRKKPLWGLAVPAIWAMLSIWIVEEAKTYISEMIIFCAGVDIILLCIWGLFRVIKSKRSK
jgi:hypothetical protein